VHHGIFVAPFGPLADPFRLMDLARAVEESGWDGLFLWDHVLRPEADEIVDPWVSLAAMATVTKRIRMGTMVTPIVRRRPIKLAREVMTLDLLSQGRVTLGLGLGVDSGGELSRFDEIVEARARGAILDEGADIVAALLEGKTVVHHGEFLTCDGVRLEPRPVQQPRPPIWCAARAGAVKPVRRAARFEGLFPIEVSDEQFDRTLEIIAEERGDLDGFDVCVRAEVDGSPPSYADRGATWVVQSFPAIADLDTVFDVIVHGPRR
jgi:alkanesulfonate monooxygenase SsuD/methylene tetrahydromethanopterin reductase-like flavin-dependent oxidoreductase (luciferase family)